MNNLFIYLYNTSLDIYKILKINLIYKKYFNSQTSVNHPDRYLDCCPSRHFGGSLPDCFSNQADRREIKNYRTIVYKYMKIILIAIWISACTSGVG